MFKRLLISLILLAFGAVVVAQVAPPPRVAAFIPLYWVLGEAESSVGGISVEDRLVIVYEGTDKTVDTLYGFGFIKNGAVHANTFLSNVVSVGSTYKVAIVQGADGYGSLPVDVTISGLGYDILPSKLVLAYGVGPVFTGGEAEPEIKLWFGNRLYQPSVYNETNPFIVVPEPTIQAKISIEQPFLVSSDPSAYSIIVDPGTQDLALNITAANMVAKAAGTGGLSAFTLEYAMSESEKLEEGTHTFKVTAQSAGTEGVPTTVSTLATVVVMSGPVRLIGTPITYPSPYSIAKDKVVTIQYGLSTNSNISIQIAGVSGQRIFNRDFSAGQEGGSAGINKVVWDGKTDLGYLVGNGIYVGTIVAKDEGRLLGTFKLTVVN